jgi:glycosyltransferase involved in cell wall biosynthesis
VNGVASAEPEVAVVVPTRDRPASLGRCLAALEEQRFPAAYEVVVVDDASAERSSIAEVVSRYPHARVVGADGAGPAAARNRGARAARGRFVLFTDDDCEPAPDWLGRLTAALGREADAVSGRTVNGLSENPLAEASQTIANHLVEASRNSGAGVPFATSNNLGCTVEVLAAIPFDERYPRAGGEDRDWCARLAAAGFVLVPEPAAVVVHRHELDLAGFWRQHLSYGRGAFRFRRSGMAGGWAESPRFYADLLRSGFQRKPAVGGLVLLAQIATVAGFLGEAFAARR